MSVSVTTGEVARMNHLVNQSSVTIFLLLCPHHPDVQLKLSRIIPLFLGSLPFGFDRKSLEDKTGSFSESGDYGRSNRVDRLAGETGKS